MLAENAVTSSCILGPFYRADAPLYENGDSIIQKYLGGDVTWFYGQLLDVDTGLPIIGKRIKQQQI